MKHLTLVTLAPLVLAVSAPTQERTGQRAENLTAVDASNFAAWREHILPRQEELRWESLPWLTSYTEGLQQAAAQSKPLLLWTMNGHPLGCT